MTTWWEVALPTVPATIAAVSGVLVYRHQRRQSRGIGWTVQRQTNSVVLERTGGGTAYDVQVDTSKASMLTRHGDHYPRVDAGARIIVGATAPPSAWVDRDRLTVNWRASRFGRRWTWSTQF